MKRKAIIITIIVVALILVVVASWLIYNKYFKSTTDDTGTDDTGTDENKIITKTSFPIKKGASGSDVTAIQKAINKKCNKNLVEDGKFGPNTETALLSCYGVTAVNETLFKEMASGTGCPEGKYPAFGGCISITTKTETGFKKGDAVYLKLNNTLIYQYPSFNSSIGKFVNINMSKPIGIYENAAAEGFSKVWMNVSAVALNGTLIKAPFWAYIPTSLIKK